MVQGRPGSDALPAPGNLNGYVWINPDYSPADGEVSDRAAYLALHPRVGRRGWVPDGCLEPAPGERQPIPRPGEGTLQSRGNGHPWHPERAVAHTVVACMALGRYRGIRPDLRDEDFTYRPYGNGPAGDPAVSIAYSTTTVEGGGTIFGYFLRGDAFHVVYATCSDDNQLGDGSPTARWAYGFGDLHRDGRAVWGWVWLGCLRPTAPSPSGLACYARCCNGALQGPSPQPDAGACGRWGTLACAGAYGVRRVELGGSEVTDAPCGCFVRCNDGSLHRFDERSAEACRADYPVCASRGRVRRIEYGGVVLYDAG